MEREQVSKDFAAAFDAAAALLKLEAPTAAAEAVSLAALLQKQLPKLALAAVEHGALTERTRSFIDTAPFVVRDLAKQLAVEFEVEPSALVVPPQHAHSTAVSLLRALRVLRTAVSGDTADVVADATKAADGIIALALALAAPEQVDVAHEFKRKPQVAQARRGRGRGGRPSTFEKGLPSEMAEAGIHVHALERENAVTKLDGAHAHLFAVEVGGEVLLLLTEEDGAHQHTLTTSGDIDSTGEHTHKVQLPDGTVIETGASISGHAHQSTTEHTAFDGVHAHTLKLGEQEFVSLLGKDIWTLAGSPPQASGHPAPAASELARLAPGVAMKALSTTALAVDNDQAEAIIERSASMIASPRRWDIGSGEVLLVCEGVALGVAKLRAPVAMDAQQFVAREREHGINAARLTALAKQDSAWADTPLFGFEVEEVALFDDPCATTVAVDASGIVRGARLVGLDQPATIVWQADPPREGALPALKVEDAAAVVQDAMATGVVLFTAKQEVPRSSFALLDRHERMHGVVVARSVRKVDADPVIWAAELELRVAFDPPVLLKRAAADGPFAGTVDLAKDIAHPTVVDVRAFVANPSMSFGELEDADVRVLDRQLHVLFEEGDALAASGLTTEQIVEAHRRVLLELTARGVGTTETDALAEASKAQSDVAKVIREQKNPSTGSTEFCVLAETTGRNFGCFPTRGEAEARLRQIEAFGDSEKVLALKRDVRLLKQDGTEPEERFVFGIVLVPNEPDAQGDIYDASEVRRAAHSFMEFFGGRMKLMHKGESIEGVKVIETYLTKTAETHGGETLPVGTWLMAVRVVDDEIWELVKGGAFTGFSIGGTAIREALAA